MPLILKIRWLFIFFLFALPVVFFPWAYLAFELPKVFLLYLFSVLAAFFLLSSGYRLLPNKKIHWLYLIFLGWVIFTAITGLFFQQSFLGSYFRMQGIITWICYGLLFFISGKVTEEEHFRKYVCLAILISSTFTAALAIIQFVSLWFLGNTTQLLYSDRVISTFGQPNFLGAYLVMSLPFVWHLLRQLHKKGKIITSFLMIMIILGIFSTLSRSAYIGLTFLALLWGIYHYRLLLIGVILSVMLFALIANLFPNLVFKQWYRFQTDTVAKWTAENRLSITQKSIDLIAQRPLTGYGLENFSLAFPNVITVKDLGLKDIVVDSSHNLFLDLAAQTGLVGLGLFLVMIIAIVFSGLKYIDTVNLEHKSFVKAAIMAVFTFIVVHQFSPYSVVPMVFFWVSLGIISRPAVKFYHLPKITKYFLSLAGIGLTIITLLFIVQTMRAEYFFRQAGAYEVSEIHKSISLDNEAIKLAPWIQFYQVRRNFLLKQLGY